MTDRLGSLVEHTAHRYAQHRIDRTRREVDRYRWFLTLNPLSRRTLLGRWATVVALIGVAVGLVALVVGDSPTRTGDRHVRLDDVMAMSQPWPEVFLACTVVVVVAIRVARRAG